MKADEIRKNKESFSRFNANDPATYVHGNFLVLALMEIAAQLAELNEHIAPITEAWGMRHTK